MQDLSGQSSDLKQPDGEGRSPPAKAAKAKSRFPQADPELVYELGRRKVELQLQQVEALDSKATGIFQAGGVLLGLVGAMFAVWDVNVPDLALGPLFFGAGFFVVIILLFVLGYLTKRWGIGPDIDEAWEHSKSFDRDRMYWWAAESFREQAKENSEKMELKELATSWLPIVFAAEVVELFLVLIITLVSE